MEHVTATQPSSQTQHNTGRRIQEVNLGTWSVFHDLCLDYFVLFYSQLAIMDHTNYKSLEHVSIYILCYLYTTVKNNVCIDESITFRDFFVYF